MHGIINDDSDGPGSGHVGDRGTYDDGYNDVAPACSLPELQLVENNDSAEKRHVKIPQC